MLKDKLSLFKRSNFKMTSQDNHYEKKQLIGKGTFGKVFLVVNKKTQQQYALKQVIQDIKYKNRELSIISQMGHPNIIEMKDYFFRVMDGSCILHIIMDYMDTSLASVIKVQRRLKQPIVLARRKIMAFQLFKALYYLQINNVCHRDLKPPNILINQLNCQLKICDFGSAKIIQKKENNVSYICSRYYRAPQLILSSSTYSCQIDMWSAGCILVEFLSLEPLFPGDSSIQQLIEIFKILGTPKKKEVTKFSSQNSMVNLPQLKGVDLGKILRRYKPEQLQLDLIKRILTYDIESRLTPYEALMHPYFKDLRTFKETDKLPGLFQFESLLTCSNKKKIYALIEVYTARNMVSRSHKDAEQTEMSLQKTNDI